MELRIFILIILQPFSSPGSKMATFLESQITNLRMIIIDCLNNDRKCTFISIYQRPHQILTSNVICYFFMLLFEIFSCICLFLFIVFIKFIQGVQGKHQEQLDTNQTLNIFLTLAITTQAIVFTYSNQKSVILCNFATFYVFKMLCFFGDVSFSYQNSIILLVYIF